MIGLICFSLEGILKPHHESKNVAKEALKNKLLVELMHFALWDFIQPHTMVKMHK
jgi:hypothetical protein